MEAVFGVKSSDIEEAYVWVERATGLAAEAHENDAWGGNYYAFGKRSGEHILLISNADPIDGEPVVDFADWSVILLIVGTETTSLVLQGIEMDSNHFEKLSTTS